MIARTSALLFLAFASIGQQNGNGLSLGQHDSLSTSDARADFLNEKLVSSNKRGKP